LVALSAILSTAMSYARDKISASSEGTGNTNNSLQQHNLQPEGDWKLHAYAFDNRGDPQEDKPKDKTGTYTRDKEDKGSSSHSAKVTGKKWKPEANAKLKWGDGWWSSMDSSAVINVNKKDAAGDEKAKAEAVIGDPYTLGLREIEGEKTLTVTITLSAGSQVGAIAGSNDEWTTAELSGNGWTNLNDMGELWSLAWSTNSSDPGKSAFRFASNSLLGLEDATISAQFMSLVEGDESTGVSSLTEDFSFSFDLTVPGGVEPEFGGTWVHSAEASMVPEPATILLVLLGAMLPARRLMRARALARAA
jgi:hypothetical protein